MKQWALCLLVLSLAAGLLSCSSTVSGSGGGTSLVSLTATPSTITSGSTSTLSWATNTTGLTGTLALSINNGVGTVSPIVSGAVSVTPAATTTYVATLTQNGTTIAVTTATVTVSGSGGGGGGSSSTVTAVPQVFYSDGPLSSVTVRILGSGFTSADTFTVAPSLWGTGNITPHYVNSTEWDYIFTLDSMHFSPGWITFQFCPAASNTCSTSSAAPAAINLAFIGNQNTAVVNPDGNLFQLSQAQGYVNPLANGYVYEYEPVGSGATTTLYPNGTGALLGAFYNSIAVDNIASSAWDYLFSLDGTIYSFVASLPLTHGQISGGVSNLTASSVLDHYGCSVYQIVVSATGSVVCTSDITAGSSIKTAVGPSSLAPWGVAMVRTYNASSTDPTQVASNNYYAVVYARGDAAVRRYDFGLATDGSISTITQPKGVVLPEFTTKGSTSGLWTDGWWIVAFNPAYSYPTASPLLGKVAVLSRYDKKLAVLVVDNLTLSMVGVVDLNAYGDPIRMAADQTNGRVIIAFANPSSQTTSFVAVDMTPTLPWSAEPAVTQLTSTATLLATGLAVSPDGTTLYACSRQTCQALANQ
jgi:hypothetical protein